MSTLKVAILILSCMMTGCITNTSTPTSEVKITGPFAIQDKIFFHIENFADKHSLIAVRGGFGKGGRKVSQIILKSGNCVLVTVDNFYNKDVLNMYFFECKGMESLRIEKTLLISLKKKFGESIDIQKQGSRKNTRRGVKS